MCKIVSYMKNTYFFITNHLFVMKTIIKIEIDWKVFNLIRDMYQNYTENDKFTCKILEAIFSKVRKKIKHSVSISSE